MRFRYLAAAMFALVLLIAFSYTVSGRLASALPQIAADIMLFLGPAAVAAGALAIVGVFARPGVVSYNTSITLASSPSVSFAHRSTSSPKPFGQSGLMAIVTVEDGRYMDVNEGYERLTGYTRDEVMGAP